jgi:hypothetical protein
MMSVLTVAVVLAATSGWFMDPVQRVSMRVELDGSPLAVYALVADPKQPWRTDLANVTVHDSARWSEVPARGTPIEFRRTEAEPGKQFAVEFSGRGFSGTWRGVFAPLAGERTQLTFTEQVTVPSPWLRPISRVFFGPEKAMRRYVADLQQATHTQRTPRPCPAAYESPRWPSAIARPRRT